MGGHGAHIAVPCTFRDATVITVVVCASAENATPSPSYRDFLRTMGTPASSVCREDAEHLREAAGRRTARWAAAYRKGAGGTRVPVRANSRKQCDKRVHVRMKGAYRKTLKRIDGAPCCSGRCLQRLDRDQLIAQVLWRTADSMEQRWARAVECAKNHREADGNGEKRFALKVQGMRVCRVAFAAAWGLGRVKAGELVRRASADCMLVVRRLHASKGLRHPSAGREDCTGWLRQFFSNYAEPFPHLNIRNKGTGEVLTKHFLTSATWPTVMSVFKDYAETESEKGHATVSFNTFRRAWLAAHYEVSTCVLSRSVWPGTVASLQARPGP